MMTKVVTCTFCGETGFVWWRVRTGKKAGKYLPCKPKLGTLEPDPTQIHFCGVKRGMFPKRWY
jgi:hypothetical protein